MARYFFHRSGDIQDRDDEGVELASLDDVWREAVLFAADTLKDGRPSLFEGGAFRVEVSDSSREVIFSIAISTTIAASPDDGSV